MQEREYHILRSVEDTHWWFRSLHELAASWVRRAAGPDGGRVVDAGCGTGGLIAFLSAFTRAEGFDASPLAVELAAERGVGDVRLGDLNDPGLEPGAYDAVTSIDVLTHHGVRDDADATRRLAEALRPGGLLFLHLPAYRWLISHHDAPVGGVRRYTLGRVRAMLEGAGLEFVHGSYRNATLLPPIAAWRLARKAIDRRPPDPEAPSDVGPMPAWVNVPLLALCRLENRIGSRWGLPFGTSVWAVGRRPES